MDERQYWKVGVNSKCFLDQVTCIQTIDVGKKYAQSIAISYLPYTTAPVMAVGSTDNRINIYAMQSKQVRCHGKGKLVRGKDDFTDFALLAIVNSSLKSCRCRDMITGCDH